MIAIAVVGLRFVGAEALLARLVDGIAQLGAWGVVLFTLLYVLATVLFFPGWILTVGAGPLFGVFEGLVVVSIASTLGATAAFLDGGHRAVAPPEASRPAGVSPSFRDDVGPQVGA